MKRTSILNTKTALAAAAVAGLLAGGTIAKASISTSKSSDRAGVVAADEKGETHDCKGKNTCKGKGGCKSGDNGCKGKNTCKGKGGCAVKDGKPVH